MGKVDADVLYRVGQIRILPDRGVDAYTIISSPNMSMQYLDMCMHQNETLTLLYDRLINWKKCQLALGKQLVVSNVAYCVAFNVYPTHI